VAEAGYGIGHDRGPYGLNNHIDRSEENFSWLRTEPEVKNAGLKGRVTLGRPSYGKVGGGRGNDLQDQP